MLIRHTDEGDAAVPTTVLGDIKEVHHCLYGLYQCNKNLQDGDTFAFNGKVLFKCEDVHVLPITS